MQRITKAAEVVATTELGEFTAIAAAYSRDRSGDEILPGAFANTIAKWQASAKQIPLHWNHSGAAADIIGTVDPGTLQEIDGLGLQVAGRVDLGRSAVADEAWRSMKNGSMSLSFGYMVVKGDTRKDGVNELAELDLFEISIVPVPANPDTKILSMKAAASEPPSGEQRAPVDEPTEIGADAVTTPPIAPHGAKQREDALAQALQEVNARLDTIEAALAAQEKNAELDQEPSARSTDPLRKQAETVALDVALGYERPPTPKGRQIAPQPDLMDLSELKQRSRDLMLQVLSGVDEP